MYEVEEQYEMEQQYEVDCSAEGEALASIPTGTEINFYPYIKLTQSTLEVDEDKYQYFEVGYINFKIGKKVIISNSDCIDCFSMKDILNNLTSKISMHSSDNYIHFFIRGDDGGSLKWDNEIGISLMSLVKGDPTIEEDNLIDIN